MANLARIALTFSAAALFGGCGGSQPPIGVPGAMPQMLGSTSYGDKSSTSAPPLMPVTAANSPTSANFRVLYNFRGHRDGAAPFGSLIDVNGLLYGTTGYGGDQNGGTVFVIAPMGKERVLWFPRNGVVPGNLTALDRTLYGTTRSTVFSLTLTGVERTFYNFHKNVNPSSLLITANRTFYGTAYPYCHDCPTSGSIFRINHSGVERVLYTFRGHSNGAWPISVLPLNGTFYGTTLWGGANDAGTVFALSPSGTLRVVHSFGRGNDGTGPFGGLIAIDGVLYGTTEGGGSGQHCSFPTGPPSSIGCGTIYSVTPSGKEHVLYSFQDGADSAFPSGNLIDVAGTLYGTAAGDPKDTFYGVGGSVFSITPAGTFRVLHTFSVRNYKDGANPEAGLTELHGTLYGTTYNGGKYDRGTVFRLQL